MTKCGKSVLPECEYFTTSGCVSPFNCPYKVENESITTATSTPRNLYPLETDKDEEISRLQAENAELRARLKKAVELPCEVGDTIYWICKACDAPCECKYYTCEYPEGATCHAPALPYGYSSGVCFSDEIVDEECKKHLYVEERKFNLRFLNAKTGKLEPQYFIDREAAEARLKEMKEEI